MYYSVKDGRAPALVAQIDLDPGEVDGFIGEAPDPPRLRAGRTAMSAIVAVVTPSPP